MRQTTELVWALALSLALVNLATADTWTRKADMPTARYCIASGEVNGKIYVIGGWNEWTDETPLATVEMYDPATDTWERKADMPTARGALAAAVLDGKIYAIGGARGRSSMRTVEVYDPITDTWEEGVSMSTGRWFHSAVVLEGRIYVIGGAYSSTMEEYNPKTGIWTPKANMPNNRWVFDTGVVHGKIYVMGGATGVGGAESETSSVLEYNPIADIWTPKTNMPTARAGLGSAIMNDRIYCIGGTNVYHDALGLTAVEVYNPATDAWEKKLDMPTPWNHVSATLTNGRIYLIGGFTDRICAIVEEYTPGPPLPDFNGDYVIGIADLLLLIEHWGGSDPAFDIAPWPSPDGIIDAQDLEALMTYWGQELDDPRLLARWTLDETEGLVAADSAGTCDGTLVGDPLWQPTGGKLAGALLFDGVEDRVTTEYVHDPADGPFSLFAWVKGGAPGQTIVSQANGVNWLLCDPATGALMTELKGAGRLGKALTSGAMITDGNWHRVGLVWDGSNRILYVDHVEVARDTQSSLAGTYAGLHIGTGSGLQSGSFFTGLIDDVRIYNRAVKP